MKAGGWDLEALLLLLLWVSATLPQVSKVILTKFGQRGDNLGDNYVISYVDKNIARIANAVQCHSLLSGNEDCQEFKFSIVRNVISVSNVSSH